MKILMINLPYAGHTNPTLGLAKELVGRGHSVTIINSSKWRDKVVDIGAIFVPYDNYPDNPSRNMEKKLCFHSAYDTALRIGNEYDVILYELLFYLGDALAKQLNKPAIRQFSMFAWNASVVDLFIHNEPFWRMLKSNRLKRKVTTLTSKGIGIEQKDMLDEILYQIPKLNIVYTSRAFQVYEKEFDSRFQFVGPSIYQRFCDIEIPFDRMKAPIIYISLGTVLNYNIFFLKRCLNAFCNQEVTVILSAGRYSAYLNKKYRCKNIAIYDVVPQLEVLQRASLFITHGGMNSVNESIYYGVPMLVAPIGSDQPTVAERVEELGLGKRISTYKTSGEEIRRFAMEIMHDQGVLAAIKKYSEDMRASGGVAKAADLVENRDLWI